MKVLVVGGGSWDDTTSLGNTLSNFFGDWENTNFYNLYFRETLPNNGVCCDYFRITTKELLKNYFVPEKNGKRLTFEIPPQQKEDAAGEKERKAISVIHRFHLKGIYNLEDYLWDAGKWKNENLDRFIDEVKPDIIFSFAAGNNYMVFPTEYIKEKTGAKLVLFVADDMYTSYRLQNDRHSKRMRRDFDRLIALADKVYGISEEMCDFYGKLYHMDIAPLYKGCEFLMPVKTTVNKPVHLLYAGNLLFGRDTSIIALIDALDLINQKEQRAVLDIYSGTPITHDMLERIQRGNSAAFHGKRSYGEIKALMAQADVVLHVESFAKDQIPAVRYSLSTKIFDCLQSGGVMLAIGPKGISSIEYLRRIPGVIVIDDCENILDDLQALLNSEKLFPALASMTRQYAVQNHELRTVRAKLYSDFKKLIGY